jgi:hypothetical protein
VERWQERVVRYSLSAQAQMELRRWPLKVLARARHWIQKR